MERQPEDEATKVEKIPAIMFASLGLTLCSSDLLPIFLSSTAQGWLGTQRGQTHEQTCLSCVLAQKLQEPEQPEQDLMGPAALCWAANKNKAHLLGCIPAVGQPRLKSCFKVRINVPMYNG